MGEFFGDATNPRHNKYNVGPFLGMQTNQFDETKADAGGLKQARNVIFEPPTLGKGLGSAARVREGRRPYITGLHACRRLADMEAGEAGWAEGSGSVGAPTSALSTAQAKVGYQSREYVLGVNETYDAYRTFPAIDLTQDGNLPNLSDHYLEFWLYIDNPANWDIGNSVMELGFDVAPGAPSWTNNLKAGSGIIAPAPDTYASNTWTKVSVPLTSFAVTGTIDLTNLTGFRLQISSEVSGAMTVYVDDACVKAQGNGHVVGLGEFVDAVTTQRHLLIKAGETLYVDLNEAKSPEKVRNGLTFSTPMYSAPVYNQIFMTDGSTMSVFDGTKSLNDTWNYRPLGFPAPPTAGVTLAAIAGGTEATVGAHEISFSYVYGNGVEVYGVSNAEDLGSITIAAGQKFQVTNLPVPAESEGVLRKRIFIGLAGDPKEATKYFAGEVTAGATSFEADVSDVTLSAPLNPVAPLDHDIPPIAKYLVPFEGSMLYINLITNPAAVAYSRRANDLTGGPEVVPITHRAINTVGEAWTAGIVRNRVLYLFTRRSVHQGRFDGNGQLVIRPMDAVTEGSSHSAGALDQNCVWIDDEGNILFRSEFGEYGIDAGDTIRPITRRRLRDEWKNANNATPSSVFALRNVQSKPDFDAGVVGANLTTPVSNLIEYQYQTEVGSVINPTPVLGNFVRGGTASAQPNLGQPYSGAGVGAGGLQMGPGGTVSFLCQAEQAVRLQGVNVYGAMPFGPYPTSSTVRASVEQYNYQFGRRYTFAPSEQYFRGPVISTGTVGRGADDPGNTGRPGITFGTWAVAFAPVFIPKGELFWITVENLGPADIDISPSSFDHFGGYTDPSFPGVRMYTNPAQAHTLFVGAGGQIWHPTTAYPNRMACVTCDCFALSDSQVIVAADPGANIVQRYSEMAGHDGTQLIAGGNYKINMKVGDVSGVTNHEHVMQDHSYAGVGIPSENAADNFFPLTDYRPLQSPPYPNIVDNHFIVFEIDLDWNSNYGYDIVDVADSLLSTTHTGVFFNPISAKVSYSSEAYPTAEPFVNDIWESDVLDTGTAPAAWGAFTADFDENQQLLRFEARSDSVSPLTTAWVPFTPNTIPAALAVNQYLQLRVIFEDDPAALLKQSSYVNRISVSWQNTDETEIRPLVPPCATFFNQYSIVAYAREGARQNDAAWCFSPGGTNVEFFRRFKISEWTNQNVNVFRIYRNTLLAGMAGTGEITEYWKGDWQDDGAGVISGHIRSNSVDLGFDEQVKTMEAVSYMTGVRESRNFVPPGGTTLGDVYKTFDAIVLAVWPESAPAALLNLKEVLSGTYTSPAQGASTPNIVSLADMYNFATKPLQAQYFDFFWRAWAHEVDIPAFRGGGKSNRFPYLTNIRPMYFLENYPMVNNDG